MSSKELFIYFRYCKEVKYIPDAAKGIHKCAEFRSLPQRIATLKSKLQQLKLSREKNIHSLQKTCNDIQASIKKLREEFNQTLDMLEKNTVQQLKRLHSQLESTLQKEIGTCDRMHDDLQKILDEMKDKGMTNETSTFIGFRKCEDKVSEAKATLNTLLDDQDFQISYTQHKNLKPFLPGLTSFGKIQTNQRQEYTVHSSRQISIVTPSDDQNGCFASGCSQLPDGTLILVDHGNNKLKLLDRAYNITFEANVPSPFRPTDICQIDSFEAAVCAGDNVSTRKVYFIDASNGQINFKMNFTFNHPCTSIVHHDGKLYVGSTTGIHVYLKTGQHIKQLYNNPESFRCKFAMSSNGERIFLVNNTDNKITTITKEGAELSVLTGKDMSIGTDVCVAHDDRVLVCGHTRTSGTVVQLNPSGTQILGTVFSNNEAISAPVMLFFNRQTSELLVGKGSGKLLILKLVLP